jgi:hypothetical protein
LSETRKPLFAGLLRYIADWQDATTRTGSTMPLLRVLWVAGSFASNTVNPGDIDLTPLIDGPAADEVRGKPGSKAIKILSSHRERLKDRYGLEVFPVRWYPVLHPLAVTPLSNDELMYTSDRGKFDDFWERCRVDGSDVPSKDGCESRRGYLEVRL